LIGAAHAGCFTMALTAELSQKGITPKRIHTVANVKLDKVREAFAITRVELQTEADIPVWFAKTLADFEINDIATIPPPFCYNS
jgi:osmotically inducible protein OsmC